MQERHVVFGPFVFDRSTATLWRDGTLLPLGGRGAALLSALLEADAGVVTKAALMERVWPGTVVEEGNLATQIGTLRKLLATGPDGQDWITTVPRVGYRFVRELAVPDSTAERTHKPSLAVLPFTNLSSDPEQDYFADGVVEDLITSLSRFRSFAVVARSSSSVYKGRAVDVREVARVLGVHYVLEGSVRRADRWIRVNAQLVTGANGAHVWAASYDGSLSDVFDFQDRIAENVVGHVEPQIRQAEIERARRKRPENLDAYDLYLRALPMMQHGHVTVRPGHYDEAILLLERAVNLDPGFAPALAYAALAHERRLARGGLPPPGVDDASSAMALALRAVAADGDDAIVLAIAGVLHITVELEVAGGFVLIRQALALNPNSQFVASVAGYAHYHCGHFDRSIECYLRALQLSPSVPEGFSILGCIARSHLAAGRIEDALAWGLRSLEFFIGFDFAHCVVAAAYAHLGREREARAAVEKVLSIWPTLTISGLLGTFARPQGRDQLLVEGLQRAGMPHA